MKKGIVLPFLLLLASIAFILGAFFLLGNKSKTSNQNPTQAAPQLQEIDTTNWKTYTDEEFGFSLQYPWNWKVTEVGSIPQPNLKRITFQNPTKDSDGPEVKAASFLITTVDINTTNFETDYKKYVDEYVANSQSQIAVDGVTGFKANSSYGPPGVGRSHGSSVFLPLKKNGANSIRIHFTRLENGDSTIFDQILSTFRFVE